MTPPTLSQIDSPVIEPAATAVALAVYEVMIVGESSSADFPLLGRLGVAGKVRSIEPERMIRA